MTETHCRTCTCENTVETAEEWEFGRPDPSCRGAMTPVGSRVYATHRRRPARAAGRWEPVPPTPEKRMLMTHPHDGHGPDDTCFECSTPTPEEVAHAD